MKLLHYFIFDNRKYSHYAFDTSKLTNLLRDLPTAMRNCYVEDSAIKKSITSSINAETVIKTYIPTKPHIKSGEFGEIIAFYMLLEKYLPTSLTGVKKWFFKPDKNKAAFYSDIVLYYCGDAPSNTDLLVSAEVKTKAVRNSNNKIQEAVKGAEEDYVSRLADTLAFLKDKSIQSGDEKNIKNIERFQHSIEDDMGPYQKHTKAIVMIDGDLCDDEIRKKVVFEHKIDNFEILIICIENLKTVYETVYEKIAKSY